MAGSPNIKFRWPWGPLWVIVALAIVAIMFGDDVTGWNAEETKVAIRWWIRAFAFFELVGVYFNAQDDDGEEEIRTLSQLLQMIGAIDESKAKWERWWKGWSALVTVYVVVLSIAAGWAFWGTGPAISGVYVNSIVIPPAVFLWLLFHFLRRYRYG